MNNIFSKIAVWFVIAFFLFTIFKQFDKTWENEEVSYSQFMNNAKSGKVKSVIVKGSKLHVTSIDNEKYNIVAPKSDIWMIGNLINYGVQVIIKSEENKNAFLSVLSYITPAALFVFFWIYMMRQIKGGGKGGAFSFGKSRARLINENNNTINFSDVAGCDEAKNEVSELVDFLKDPKKFQKLGGKIPRGVLLIGEPGTGKTLLAKAIAGEAKVPFFSISGSDFVEMFVGVGAARVRDMFYEAKKHSPCIIFIDEIDAVGRHRGVGMGGGNDEREQTLNQMLVEMDGFEENSGIIVIAATNRSDVLDKALLRPGRFDRQVHVWLPDILGRENIMKVHLKKVPISSDVDPSIIARSTPGFSGADLANLVNEAALFAARQSKRNVEMQDFENAKDKIFMGPERKSAVIREETRRTTAYHESGHAVIAKLLPKSDPVHKVTIIPRGRALGLTWQLPEHDYETHSKEYLLDRLAILFGGRAAEELFLNLITTGASDDFNKATQTARAMVTKFGMTDALGTMVYIDEENDKLLFGKNYTRVISEATQQKVDEEIRRVLDAQYNLAKSLLKANREIVESMTMALIEFETIDSDQIEDIMAGRKPRLPKGFTKKMNDKISLNGNQKNDIIKVGSDRVSTVPA